MSHSPRAQAPFVALNCAGVCRDAARIGAVRPCARAVSPARTATSWAGSRWRNRGTAFLDEIGEMSPRMQALLLRFLENGEIQKVGSRLHFRARRRAHHRRHESRPEKAWSAKDSFAKTCWYRIKVVHLHIPPLRERREDIPVAREARARAIGSVVRSSAGCRDGHAQAVCWPGNVRELQNVIEQVISIAGDQAVGVDDLPSSVLTAVDGRSQPVARSAPPSRRRICMIRWCRGSATSGATSRHCSSTAT